MIEKPDDIILSVFEGLLCFVSSFVSEVLLLEMNDFLTCSRFSDTLSFLILFSKFMYISPSSMYIIVNS